MAPNAGNAEDEDLFATPDEAADEAATLRGLEDAAAGRFVEHDEVMRWVESWSSGQPLPRPKCGE
jgi:predicted transcriptional regulator